MTMTDEAMVADNLELACRELHQRFSGERWWVAVGQFDARGDQRAVVYVTNLKQARLSGVPETQRGIPVVMRRTSRLRPAKETLR